MGKKGVRGNIGADVDAVIRESDLIEFDGSFGQLAKLLKGSQKNIEDYMNALSSYAPKIRQNFSDIFSFDASKLPDSDKLRLAAQLIDQIYNAELKLAASRTETAKTLALVNEAISKNTQANKLWAQQMAAADGSINQMNASVKQLKDEWLALSDAEREGAQGQAVVKKIVAQTTSINKLNAAIKSEIDIQMKLDSVTRQRNAAMSTEMKQVSAIRQELNTLNRQRELEIKAANAAAGSYDQLAAMYELGKLKLKGMAHETKEQINVFEAYSQELAKIYKQMMDMQEATGKHTLSVGDYGKAFRSLSTETGMLVRELPALAVSANTFFLAISNNLPMFMSAVNRMKKENEALRAQGLTTTSVFKTVMKSVLSWQTAVIIALSFLSKYGSKVVDWFKKISGLAKQVRIELIDTGRALNRLSVAGAEGGITAEIVELDILAKRIGTIQEGTTEYYNTLKRISEITGEEINLLGDVEQQVRSITQAYVDRQVVLAKNAEITQKIAKSDLGKERLQLAVNGTMSPQDLATIIGGSKQEELLKNLTKARGDWADLSFLEFVGMFIGSYSSKTGDKRMKQRVSEATQWIENYLREEYGILSEDAEAALRAELKALPQAKRIDGNSTPTEKSVDFDPFFERMKNAEALEETGTFWLDTIRKILERELAIEQVSYEKSEVQRKKYWQKQLDNLEYNYNKGLITEQEYIDALGEENVKGLTNAEKYAAWRKRIENQMRLDLIALNNKHISDRQKAQEEAWDKEAAGWKTYYSQVASIEKEAISNTTDINEAKSHISMLEAYRTGLLSLKNQFDRTANGAEIFAEILRRLDNEISSANLVVAKLDIELTKTNTQLQKFGRANSELGQRRNLVIASSNVTKLSEAIAHWRKEQDKLNKSSKEWLEYEKQINAYLQQIEQQVNRVNISKLIDSDSGLVMGLINSAIDAADPATLMQRLSDLKFGEVAKLYMKDVFAIAGDSDLYDAFEEALKNNDGNFSDAIESVLAEQTPEMQKKIKDALEQLGLKAGDDLNTIFKKIWSSVSSWFNQTVSYLKDLAQAYTDLAEAKAEAAAAATDAAQEEYDKEKALLEAGYANQVETKWAEYQEKKAIQEQAETDAKKAAQAQADIETAQQTMSLITASANIFKTMTETLPAYIAIPAAITMIGTMAAAFIAAKAKAAEAATVQYGEGHAELIGGGTHVSGHDSPLAYDNQGRERRVERGEVVGIFKSRAVREIGASRLIRNIDNINRGRYTELATKAIDRGSNLNMLAQSVETSHADLSKLESGVNKIARQGEKRTYVDSVGNIIVETPYGKTTYAKR